MKDNSQREQTLSIPTWWRRKKARTIFGLLVAAAVFLWWCQRVPLPTDEEMIAHFQAHRVEFEELVRRNRTFVEREHWPELKWPPEEEGTRELWRKAGVGDVNYLSLLHWLPDPYNVATAQRVKAINDECTQDVKHWRAIGGDGRASTPPPKCRLLGYQYGVLVFNPKLPNNAYHAGSWRYVAVWKGYLHFPEPPRIEQGYLLGPLKTNGQYSYKERVRSSLNFYPFGWKEYECVYRPIEAHWFITLCNGH